MSEIKTCEQYVLAELLNKDKEIEILNEQIDNLKQSFNAATELVTLAKELLSLFNIKLDTMYDGETEKIEVESIYNQYSSKEDFKKAKDICERLGIELHTEK